MRTVSTTAAGYGESLMDICYTSPSFVLAPFPNFALCRNAEGTSDKIVIQNKPVITKASKIPSSIGGTPPALFGIVSAVLNSECRYQTALSEKVRAESQKVALRFSGTGQNGFIPNCIGIQTESSQSIVRAS